MSNQQKNPFGKKISTPFGIPIGTSANQPHQLSQPVQGFQPLKQHQASKPAPGYRNASNPEPLFQQQSTDFNKAFANVFTPMLAKLPAKALPDYKPFAEAGFEIAKTTVENSGIKAYCSFDPFKSYFNITNLYVLRKLMLIIAPFTDCVIPF